MKNLLMCILLLLPFAALAQSPDLPPPPANIVSMPKGSYIIPMDTIYQRTATLPFNLKAYGLAVYLLNKRVKLKWIIATGKVKDGVDFSVQADQVKPASVIGGIAKDFKCGPFVIFTPDTAGVAAMVDAFYTANSLLGGNRPTMYVSKTAVNVDVRYNLVAPKGAILTDGGNQAIHLGYMAVASIPTQNYTTSAGDNLTNCFSFASEPHNTASGPLVDTAIVHIRNFMLLGGNFLAQCAAVSNYENNPLGRFQTTTGISVPNTNIGATLNYPNPDLSYSQFQGAFFSYDGASVVQNWQILGATKNSDHHHATGSGIYTSYIAASVSKIKGGNGGLAFYLSCHDFLLVPQQLLTINGLRMYFNAFITPSSFTCPLPLSLISFSGNLLNGKPQIKWTTAENETGDHFELEKSFDGRSFSTTASIPTTPKEGLESYVYNETSIINGSVYYRLKMVNKNFTVKYSKVILIKTKDDSQAHKLTILENPVNTTINFSYTAAENEEDKITIYNTGGAKVFSTTVSIRKGPNTVSLSIDPKIASGIYVMELANAKEIAVAKLVKQ
jgi:hypothetical protein